MNKTPFDHRDAMPEESDGIGRRRFITTSVAVGFAAAVQPVMADAIHTGSDGIVAGEVKVKVPDGEIPAYRAYPAKGNSPFPIILVAHEIFGVHEYIQDVCRRLAKLGYFAISSDLYSRQGDVSKIDNIKDILANVVSKVSDQQFLGDLDATVAYASSTGKGDGKRLGITGFCWGGRVTWMYAAHNPKVKAGVAWYGPLGGAPEKAVINHASEIKGAVLGLYGGKDTGIPMEDVEKMRAAIKGGKSEIVVYPEAPHGFHADYRPSYDATAAADGWNRLETWFKLHGVA